MSLPVRCFTCGKVIGNYEEKFVEFVNSGGKIEDFLNRNKFTRICCRRMFLGYVDPYDKPVRINNVQDKSHDRKK